MRGAVEERRKEMASLISSCDEHFLRQSFQSNSQADYSNGFVNWAVGNDN